MLYDSDSKKPATLDFARDIALRASAISMGFVFLMGGWRRFYNVPAKHDITSPGHLANKLVEAAPGSPVEAAIHWVLYNPLITEWSVYVMSTAEVLVGLALIFGLLTRLAATGSALINIALMLIFGWMGFECLDEWTMAALGFAISVSVVMFGPGSFSLDQRFGLDVLAKYITRPVAISLTALSILMTGGFYSYYFGIFDFHKLTSTGAYNIVANEVPGHPDQATLYVNAGGSSTAAYVKSITFTLQDGAQIIQNAEEISVIHNHFAPWSHSGKVVDGVLKLRLGSLTDIQIPAGAQSAVIDLIDNKDPVVHFTQTGN
ncbi:TQO small subunit DoxD [uncultured Thalassospira sp.]|uniref:TQO small subunit DoxD n=1 Tax=uncultured Thalassospira sp. TaxID=404382 RepID=UPI0030DDDE12|tara:strand:+ start:8362 stop:9315 length:954 start_codon:yes stop_codon:yes gene_type:complete